MNSKLSKYGNKRMLFCMMILCCGIFGLWYFFHPMSPHNVRLHYVAIFDEVGPLASGNNVKISGLSKGRILKMHKTDSCIYVTFEVVKNVRLPIDSKFLFANAGFLGNREIQITLGTSSKVYQAGDTIRQTVFDKGLNSASDDLKQAMTELHDVMTKIDSVLAELKDGKDRKQFDRIVRKGKNLSAEISNDAENWKSNLLQIFDAFSESADKLKSTADQIANGMDAVENDGEKMIAQLKNLQQSAENEKQQIQEILAKLDRNDNSAALILQKGSKVLKQLEQVSESVSALLKGIKKNGLRLNVDFF